MFWKDIKDWNIFLLNLKDFSVDPTYILIKSSSRVSREDWKISLYWCSQFLNFSLWSPGILYTLLTANDVNISWKNVYPEQKRKLFREIKSSARIADNFYLYHRRYWLEEYVIFCDTVVNTINSFTWIPHNSEKFSVPHIFCTLTFRTRVESDFHINPLPWALTKSKSLKSLEMDGKAKNLSCNIRLSSQKDKGGAGKTGRM